MTIANTDNDPYTSGAGFTLPNATNRYVLFLMAFKGNGSDSAPPTSASIDGVAMTKHVEINTTDEMAQIWGLWIPNDKAAGDYAVVHSGETADVQRWNTAVFSGVARDAVVHTASARSNNALNDGSTLTLNCADGGWVYDVLWAVSFNLSAKVPGEGQTVVYNEVDRPSLSYKSNLTGSSTTMSWTWANSTSAHAAISLRPHRGGSGIIMF